MKKNEEKTKNKLQKLSESLGEINIYKEKEKKEINYSPFKTSEVALLLIITCIVSICMGGLITYKINSNKGKYLDKELQAFIKNYEYITDNYYEKIDKEKLVDSAIEGMLSTLDRHSTAVGDTDSEFNIQLEGNYKGIGIQVFEDEDKNIKVYSVFKNSPASKAGLKAGDILLKINNKTIEGKSTSDISNIIKSQKKSFKLTYKRDDKENTVDIKLSTVDLTSVVSKVFEKEDKKIGYIYTSIFAGNTYKQFKKELEKLENKKIDSLIIDLRENSGGHLTAAEDILSLFLDSTHPIYQIKAKDGNDKYYSKGKKDKKYKIVILVNNSSASASELTTSALKEQYGAIVIGEKTFGKGTVQELQTLPSGQQYKLTTKTWLTSKGNIIDGKGINPDIEVSLGEEYSKEPKEENDNQLNKAIDEAIK